METTETKEYKGYTINIHYDDSPSNPFEEWDSEPPLIACYRDYSTSYGLDNEMPELTLDQIKSNAEGIKEYVEDFASLMCGMNKEYRDQYSSAEEAINEKLAEYFDELYPEREQIKFLSEVYDWMKIPNLLTTVRGCSQGDWAEVLIVATPEWQKKVGAKIDKPSDLQGTADLYESWAFGNVYGYTINDPGGEEIDGSCWGFYGWDHDKSGLMENAVSDIDYEIRYRRNQRLKKTKTFIKHNVPLQIRQEMLAGMPA